MLFAANFPAPYSGSVQLNQQDSAQGDWIRRLCPECGLCCNGVLFADVRLVKGDNPLTLEKSGLTLKKAGRKVTFEQPCGCFDGRLCTAYEQRPARCRGFNCHTLKQSQAAEISQPAALKRIREAKTRAAEVTALLRLVGNHEEHLPLTRRYQLVMSEPIDLADDEARADQRGELMLAVNDLMHRLQRDFL